MKHYTIDYFIDYFEGIEAKYFSKITDKEQLDVWSWCSDDECKALYWLTYKWGDLSEVNDGSPGYDIFGDDVKDRVLNFLTYIKGIMGDEA